MCNGCQLLGKHYACVTDILSFVPLPDISVYMNTLSSVVDTGKLASPMDPFDFSRS